MNAVQYYCVEQCSGREFSMCNPNQLYSDVKEKIINQTISLIENSDGLVESITIRYIAQKADVAVGLINYHFGSRCV